LAPLNEDEHSKRENIFTSICGLLGDSISLPATTLPNLIEDYWEMKPYGDDVEDAIAFLEADLTDAAGKPFAQHSLADALINAKVLLPNDDGTALARVVKRVVGPDGKLIGEYKDNPLLTSCSTNANLMMVQSRNMQRIQLLLKSSLNQMKMDSRLQFYITLLIINLQGRQSRWLTSISAHQMKLNACVKQCKGGSSLLNGPLACANRSTLSC
jgi:hypothetical protein